LYFKKTLPEKMKRLTKNYPYYLLFGFLVLFNACNDDDTNQPSGKNVADYSHESISVWNQLFLKIERYAAGYRPGPAPRAHAYLGLANYEACISGMPDFNTQVFNYAGLSIPQANGNDEYHWPTVVNASSAFLMRGFFPNNTNDINALETQYENKYLAETSQDIFDRSVAHGQAVASAVWEWSKTDAVSHDAYLDPFAGYNWQEHFDGPGDWVPTVPGPPQPMFGLWGQARVFAISETDKLCPAPFAYGENINSAFYAQALEVYSRSVNPSYEDEWIAEFWSDDLINLTFSPGPRWIAIADQVYEAENSSLETAIYANVKVGMALNDAAVSCWHSKYVYNVERPESFIQRVIDPNYEPLLYNPITFEPGNTPAFPAYPSGHSTMGAAAAEALTDIFGIRYTLTDRCHENRTEFEGKPRLFYSFYDMAEENAISRVPLGVHYRMDCEVGVDLGYRCGRKVNALNWKK